MSIIATVIGGVILLLKKITRKRLSPNANYVIWLVFLVVLIFPVAIPSRVSIYNYIDISDVKEVRNSEAKSVVKLWETENDNDVYKDVKDNISRNNKEIWINYLKRIIAFTWFTVSIVLLTRRNFSYFAMNRLIGDEEVADERVISLFETCKKKLKIRKNIKLIRQDFTTMPSTSGIFNVKILVSDFFLELDDISITSVFMHELSHYKRKDNLVNFIILILKSLHWFNPAMAKMFKIIRDEMELATDEIAISKMDVDERMDYCKSMVAISATSSLLELEQVLGLLSTAKVLEKRIKMISLKENFEKNSKMIAGVTILITILMCLILYPTSYGMFETPRLYVKLANGDKVEASKIDENTTINEINLKQNDKVDLVVKGGRTNNYIFYTKINSDTMELSEDTVNISDGKMEYFETGEAIYKFTLTYGNNKSIDYALKFIVE